MAHGHQLEARKRQLLAQSELNRRALCAEISQLDAATAWIPRARQYARMTTPLLALLVPAVGFFFSKRKRAAAPPPKKNLLGKIIAGYQIVRRVKPIWDSFQRSRAPQF